jgi:hypothetical protein
MNTHPRRSPPSTRPQRSPRSAVLNGHREPYDGLTRDRIIEIRRAAIQTIKACDRALEWQTTIIERVKE